MNAVYARGFGSRVSGPMVCDMIVPDPKDCSAPLRNRREETEDAVIVCEMGPVDFALQVKKDIYSESSTLACRLSTTFLLSLYHFLSRSLLRLPFTCTAAGTLVVLPRPLAASSLPLCLSVCLYL